MLRLSFDGALSAETLKKFLCHDVAYATGRIAAARIFSVILQIKTVVERNLLARFDVAARDNPDAVRLQLRIAIWLATVIDKPRWVPRHVSVQMLVLSEHENVFIVPLATPQGLPLFNSFAHVFE